MLELFPEGFEEIDDGGSVELAAYTGDAGEERLWQAFGGTRSVEVEEDWEERWKRFHRPVRVGPLWIGPPWESAPPGVVPVVIDPGRAFGTGGHPTTRLCLELLLAVRRASLLDIGCGSGVLAIAAAKLGFAPVVAVDVDPLAVEATTRNATANAVEVDARVVDALEQPLPDARIALANIALAPVCALAGRVSASVLVTSGYLVSEQPALEGFRRVDRRDAEGWAADLHVRHGVSVLEVVA